MGTQTRIQRQADNLKDEGKKVVRQASTSPLMEGLTRLGYLVRGLVYGVIGLLALQVALGTGGALDDPQGAIVTMGRTRLGGIALYGILIGLIGYALWGIVRAVIDPLHKGTNLKGIAERLGYAISGISYGLLALATYGLITGDVTPARNGAQAAQTQQATASILSKPWGPSAVAVVGVIVTGVGLWHIVEGLRLRFRQQFQLYMLSNNQRKWIARLGRFGTVARGLVFALVGMFLVLAAYRHDSSQAQGIDGVLRVLLQQPYGPWLLGIVALGLIAFGIYSAVSGLVLRLKR
jgi:type IV secretory pathway VirB2 component (pilin)